MKKRIVFIAECLKNHDDITLVNKDLEFLSEDYFDAIITAFNVNKYEYVVYHDIEVFIEHIKLHKNDIVFSLWSGTSYRGRKTFVSAICEAYGILYVGSSSYTNFLCADKYLAKKYCSDFGMKSAKSILFNSTTNYDELKNLCYPLVVKPNYEGGSNGISGKCLVYNEAEAISMIENLYNIFHDKIIVEEFIPGKEITVVVMRHHDEIHIVGENLIIINGNECLDNEIYSFETKKQDTTKSTKRIVQLLPEHDKNIIKEICLSFDKVDFIRFDGRIKDGEFYMLELSPDASLSMHSSMYNVFENLGVTYADMIDQLIKLSIENSSISKCQ